MAWLLDLLISSLFGGTTPTRRKTKITLWQEVALLFFLVGLLAAFFLVAN